MRQLAVIGLTLAALSLAAKGPDRVTDLGEVFGQEIILGQLELEAADVRFCRSGIGAEDRDESAVTVDRRPDRGIALTNRPPSSTQR
jgi:hypothetical protein